MLQISVVKHSPEVLTMHQVLALAQTLWDSIKTNIQIRNVWLAENPELTGKTFMSVCIVFSARSFKKWKSLAAFFVQAPVTSVLLRTTLLLCNTLWTWKCCFMSPWVTSYPVHVISNRGKPTPFKSPERLHDWFWDGGDEGELNYFKLSIISTSRIR